MAGFMITVSSNARGWYLAGSIFFLVGGIALSAAGFATLGTTWGIVGIVVAVASLLFLADAISNMRG
jgi:NAD/NADP transhydrogenase beta subunit